MSSMSRTPSPVVSRKTLTTALYALRCRPVFSSTSSSNRDGWYSLPAMGEPE